MDRLPICGAADNQSPSIDARIAVVLEFFDRQLPNRDLKLDIIAETLNLSASRLRHLFTRHVGLSPTQYQKRLRLREAHKLLQGSFLRIKEIAAAVGFTDMSHFVRDYKLAYGETPSQTRMSQGAFYKPNLKIDQSSLRLVQEEDEDPAKYGSYIAK